MLGYKEGFPRGHPPHLQVGRGGERGRGARVGLVAHVQGLRQARPPQRERLVQVADAQLVEAALHERLRRNHGAVAIAVALFEGRNTCWFG